MPRYWVNIPLYYSAEEVESLFGEKLSKKRKKVYNEVVEKFMERGCRVSTGGIMLGTLVYKTNDLEDAREFKEFAKKELKSIEEATGLFLSEELTISTQPECPKCGYLGRFGDSYCPDCGTELMETEFYD